MAQVLLDGINKVYDNGFHAVHDLTLHIADGEFLVLVGPSGCGKTTAMRMVAGLEDITSGELRIGDRVVNTISPRDRDIAMVFQSYALYPHMTVGDNIAYGLKLRKMPKEEIEARIAKAAKMLELTELLDRKPKQLSGGQRQRVAMGRAIVRQPQVFLMDEPLSNLDAKLRVQMRAEISSVVHELKTTTIYVTHDQVEAMTMGDRIAVMKKGVLQQIGEPQHIYDNPDNIFVAQFIGSPPMNLAMGRIEREGDGLVLVLAGARLTVPASVIAARPKLHEYAGREVAVGVRSEDMEDALFKPDAPEGSRLSSRVVLTEALGSEVIVHFELDAKSVETEDTAAIAADSKSEGDVGALAVAGVKWVASFAPRSRVRVGDVIEIVVDTEQIHYFDPQTSAAIR